jgi:MYXO-CTERM domain-containing protein
MRRLCVTLALLLLGANAAAYSSKQQPVIYTGEKNLFSDIDFDTGWVPASSPIQVRFAIHVGTGWTVQAGGKGDLSWPEPLTFQMVGSNQAGSLEMNLGIEMLAKLRVCIPLPNCGTLDWEGDVPYIPNFDYRFYDQAIFTPFLLPGANPASAVAADTIDPVTLFQIDLLSLIGISIPGVSGGFELKAGGTITSTLTGERFDLEDGLGAVFGTIATDPGSYILPLPDPPHRDAWPNWHADLNAVGTLNLQPAVYIEFNGSEYSLALFTLPLDIVNIDFPWDFGTKKMTFPLPVIRVTDDRVDFGVLTAGVTTTRDLKIDNGGEMDLTVDATVEGGAGAFSVPGTTLTVGPGASGYLKVTVTAPNNNASGTLRLASNDPKKPFIELPLQVAGQGDVEQIPGDGGTPLVPEEPDPAKGCGCATAPASASGLALLVLALVVGRRRR